MLRTAWAIPSSSNCPDALAAILSTIWRTFLHPLISEIRLCNEWADRDTFRTLRTDEHVAPLEHAIREDGSPLGDGTSPPKRVRRPELRLC